MSNLKVDCLKHILGEINFLLQESNDLEFEIFIQSEKDKRAFTRSLEIIGEVIKNLPDEIRKEYPDVNWKAAAGLRDRLNHGYFNIDYEIVWGVISVCKKMHSVLRKRQGQGARSPKKRNVLCVHEHFLDERNAEIDVFLETN